MDYHLIHVQKFNLPVDCMRVAFEGSYNDLKLLDNPSKVLKELGFFKNNRVFESLKYFFPDEIAYSSMHDIAKRNEVAQSFTHGV